MNQLFFLYFLTPLILVFHSLTQIIPGLYVLSPGDGHIVTGTVEIRGSVPEDGFNYAEISYAFEDENASNWFLIKRLDQPVHDVTLALWDTTTITDGIYRLRVAVYRKDGTSDEILLKDIRVGNYTHFDEPTPTLQAAAAPSQPVAETVMPTETSMPQPTDLPKNPASIEAGDIRSSLSAGLILALLFMAVLGVYALIRRAARM